MHVRIYHPELDTTIEVPESAVPIHKNSGWQLAGGEPPAEPENSTDQSADTKATEPEKPASSKARGGPAAKDSKE